MNRALGTGVGLALVLALGAACGGKAETPPVATAGGASTSATPASDTVQAYVESQRVYAKCLREHGMNVPDPDAKGSLDINAGMGSRPKTDPSVQAALEACQEFAVPVPEELELKEELTPEQAANRRAYAKCMRANGVPTWPDPLGDGTWPEAEPAEQTPQQQAAFLAAGQICGPVLDGRPPTTPNPNDLPKG